jgi:TPR repeat protein
MAKALAAARNGDYETALAIWEPLARAGNARAQNNIGACFAGGLGVARDTGLAYRWLSLSAEAGDPVGQRNLASLLFRGEGIAPDYQRAAALYRQAAEQNDAEAQDMLLEGDLIEPDFAEARRWALAAAKNGSASSMTRLGMLYHNAIGVTRDPVEAAYWWGRGAQSGDADGQAMLGAAYHLGSGVARDPVEAFAWLIRARHGGSALAAPFFDVVRTELDAEELMEAERRAALPLTEAPVPLQCAKEGGQR